MTDGERDSEIIRLSEAFGVAGSADHDPGGVNHAVLEDAFAELHPATAANLVRHIRKGLEKEDGAVASGSEHPDWHRGLRQAIENSDSEGYDV